MPWTPGTATGLGPIPGVDPLETARIIFSEVPDLPFLPELPARGVGADQIGRTAALLADLHVEVGTGVWRFVPRGGRDAQRAHVALTTDLDALEEAAEHYAGPLKVRIVGPWSLAASIELAKGEKALADPGAVRDLTASLAEGLTRHLADIRKRIPTVTRLVVQVDEPLLPAVVAGELATASGWGRLRSYEEAVVEDKLRQVLQAASAKPARSETSADDDGDGGSAPRGPDDIAGVWLGTAPLDVGLLQKAGAQFVGLHGAVLDSVDEDEVGEAIDAGLGLLVACVPLEAPQSDPRPVTASIRSLWKRLAFPMAQLPTTVALAPVEGLEQVDVAAVPGIFKRTVEAARYLDEFAAEETS
jgi:hypothetical protein